MHRNPFEESNALVWAKRMVLLLLLGWLLPAWAADSRIIDQVEIDTSGDRTRVRIDFNIPLQYIRHTPKSHGDKIVLQFRPLAGSQSTDIDFSHQEEPCL